MTPSATSNRRSIICAGLVESVGGEFEIGEIVVPYHTLDLLRGLRGVSYY